MRGSHVGRRAWRAHSHGRAARCIASPAPRTGEVRSSGTCVPGRRQHDAATVVAIACRALARDNHILAAHHLPARKIDRPAA